MQSTVDISKDITLDAGISDKDSESQSQSNFAIGYPADKKSSVQQSNGDSVSAVLATNNKSGMGNNLFF